MTTFVRPKPSGAAVVYSVSLRPAHLMSAEFFDVTPPPMKLKINGDNVHPPMLELTIKGRHFLFWSQRGLHGPPPFRP